MSRSEEKSLSQKTSTDKRCIHCGKGHDILSVPLNNFDVEYQKELARLALATSLFVKEYLDSSSDNSWRLLNWKSIEKIGIERKQMDWDKKNVNISCVKKELIEMYDFCHQTGVEIVLPVYRIVRMLRKVLSFDMDRYSLSKVLEIFFESSDRYNLFSELFPSATHSYDNCYMNWLKYAERTINIDYIDMHDSIKEIWRETAFFLAKSFGYRISNYTFFHKIGEKESSGFVYTPEWLKPFPENGKYQGLDSYKPNWTFNDYFINSQGAMIRSYASIGAKGIKVFENEKDYKIISERSFDEVLLRRTSVEQLHQMLLVPDGEMSFRAIELYAMLKPKSIILENDIVDEKTFTDDSVIKFFKTMGFIKTGDNAKTNNFAEAWKTTPRAYRMIKWLSEIILDKNNIYKNFIEREPFLKHMAIHKEMNDLRS